MKRARLNPVVRGKPFPPAAPAGGRVPPNKIPAATRLAIVGAADRYGVDGKGNGGMVGYFYRLAGEYPVVFGGLLAKLLPVDLRAEVDSEPPQRFRVLMKSAPSLPGVALAQRCCV